MQPLACKSLTAQLGGVQCGDLVSGLPFEFVGVAGEAIIFIAVVQITTTDFTVLYFPSEIWEKNHTRLTITLHVLDLWRDNSTYRFTKPFSELALSDRRGCFGCFLRLISCLVYDIFCCLLRCWLWQLVLVFVQKLQPPALREHFVQHGGLS
jgi:hypothetical protein